MATAAVMGSGGSGSCGAWLGNPVGIPRNFAIIPITDLPPPEFSFEFHFSDRKTCSCQFGTCSRQFGILSHL